VAGPGGRQVRMTGRTAFFRLAAAALAVALICAPASARQAPPPPSGPAWAELTRADVEAAYALLRDNHPGALPLFGDVEFTERLERGHATAVERAARVTDAGGHRAVLNGFAAGMGDGHIAWQPT